MKKDKREDGVIGTYTGLAVAPLHLREKDIRLGDIVHSLSQQNRFTGHTRAPWSVAQHSMLVGALLAKYGAKIQLYGLLHDASEAYVVDVPKPIKHLFVGYKKLEHAVQRKIYRAFGLDSLVPRRGDPVPELVGDADRVACKIEVSQLFDPNGYTYKREVEGQDVPVLALAFRTDPLVVRREFEHRIRCCASYLRPRIKVRVEDW